MLRRFAAVLRRFAALLLADAAVAWTWVASSVLSFGVQMGLGLGRPSEGLALSSAALPAMLVAALPLRLRRRGMVAVVTLTALLGVVNALHHRAFQTYLPLSALLATDQAWAIRGYAAGLLAPADRVPALVVLATLLGALLARWRESRGRERLGRRTQGRPRLPAALCLAGSVPALAWAWVVAPADADNQTGGFLYGHVADGTRLVRAWAGRGDLTPDDMARILRATEGEEPPPADARALGANVLMIQVEALNGWVLDLDVGGEPVMPFLRGLAQRGLVFSGVFDDTHVGRSSDADYLALVSQHPTAHDAVAMTHPGQAVVALPGLLAERGYHTLAAHAHAPGFWNARERRERYGFREQLYAADLGPGEQVGFGLVDGEMLRRMAPRIAALPTPWMAWLVTLTMHAPHPRVPASFPRLPLGELEGTSLGNYLRAARHTDDALGQMVASLDSAGALDATLLVVYGDHTELRGLDAEWVERRTGVAGLPPDARRLLLDRVALVMVPPGDPGVDGSPPQADRVVPTVGGLVDIAPTVLHLMGMARPRPFAGRSLLGPWPGLAAQASGEVVGDGLMWTGSRCYRYPAALPLPAEECDGIRARARDELEVSWLITRHALGPELARR